MRCTYSVLLAIVFLSVSVNARADATPKKKTSSNQPIMSQHEMNDSFATKYRLVDDELNRLYNEKLSVIETPKNKERFRDAQRDWNTFRDSACLYEEGTRDEIGSMWALGYFLCMERYTRRRIEDMEGYIKCTPEECQN